MGSSANPALRLRTASLACLLDIGRISDTYLILGNSPTNPHPEQTDAGLLSARWKDLGGNPADPQFAPWIELFTAYQQYQRSELGDALETWKLVFNNDKSPSDARGLAGLGILEIAGEVLRDARKRGVEPQISLSDAVGAGLGANLAWDTSRSFAIGQVVLLEAQIYYIVGDQKQALETLKAAEKWFEGDRSGWVDLTLIAAIGESRIGDAQAAEHALLQVEDAIQDHRVPIDQVKTLADFARRLPAIAGGDDNRSIDLKLADAREFYRWANATGDPLLELISLRTLSQLLREGGYWSDAAFYSAVEEDLGQRYRWSIPFRKRLRTAVLLDYDFLRETRYLESQDPFPLDLTKVVEAYTEGQKGMIDTALQYLPGTTKAEATANLEHNVAPLREIATAGDAARVQFRAAVKAQDFAAAETALIASANALLRMETFLNHRGTTSMPSGTETINEENLGSAGLYKIHAEITSEFRIARLDRTDLEIAQDKTYLDRMVHTLLGALKGEEQMAKDGAKHVVTFYDRYRNEISPPDSVDMPFMFSGQAAPSAFDFPDSHREREKLIDDALAVLRARHRKKIIAQSATAAGLQQSQPSDGEAEKISEGDRAALEFFERNFERDELESHEDKPEVTSGKDGQIKQLTIKQSYKTVFNLKKTSEYFHAPVGIPGLDIEHRAEAARRAWLEEPAGVGSPRLDNVLDSLYRQRVGDELLGEFSGVTPEQLATRKTVFSGILDPGQMALSAERADDFLMLPGEPDFRSAKEFFRKDASARHWLTAATKLDPNAKDRVDQSQKFFEEAHRMMAAFDAQYDGASDLRDQSPVRSGIVMVSIAASLANRPIAFLLLDDRPSAEQAARQMAAASDSSLVQQKAALADYYIAAGNYPDAIKQLSPLAAALREKEPLSAYQIEYLLAMCYRRIGDHKAELQSLLTSAAGLDRFRTTLATRNEASRLQPLRQMLYEELLSALFSQKQYAEMAAAIRRYQRSSQIPVAVLEQGKARDPQVYALLQDAAFAYDVLSRDEVWKAKDFSQIFLDQPMPRGAKAPDPRDVILSSLNHMTEVLVDQLGGTSAVSSPSADTKAVTPQGALALSYFAGRAGLYRVATYAGVTSARFVPASDAQLGQRCQVFRAELQEHEDSRAASAQLYDVLLGELPQLQTAGRLYISPDGVLNFIPFQALKSKPEAPYLVQEHTITYLTGAQAGSGTTESARRLLLVGNPDGSLPAAEDEVNQIAGIKGFETRGPLLNSAATLDHVRQQLSGADSVHFATHARANEASPNFAYLQLANRDRIYSYNLGGLAFTGKNIFLSACETRVGSIMPGDDVYGIADAFLAAGAPSVVATLWRVESTSSGAFARRYYELLAQKQDSAEAVAEAAREFIEGKVQVTRSGRTMSLNEPLYWAAFSQLAPRGAIP